MDAIDLLNETQEFFVSDSTIGVSKAIVYTHKSGTIASIRAFVGNGIFNEKDGNKLSNRQTFSSLKLTEKPTVDDTILYEGIVHEVEDSTLNGSLWAVDTKTSRHKGI